ncbi:MAG: hypothetical protein IPI88_18850 [Chitinophagaceae bacterium]|nr:hypothetical protein [Chitinophagaceae bacterium]
MKRKIFFALFLIIISVTYSVAQTNLPNVAKADLSESETQVLNSANWIITTGLTVDLEKRKPANGIVLKWYIDTITLNIKLVEKLSAIYGANSDLLMMFFAGYSKFYLENKKTATNSAATKAGLISLLNVYKRGIGVTKGQELEKLVALADADKIDYYIKNNFD